MVFSSKSCRTIRSNKLHAEKAASRVTVPQETSHPSCPGWSSLVLPLVPPVLLGRQSGPEALKVEPRALRDLGCKTVQTEHLPAFWGVQYKGKQGMEASYTPITLIRHRVSLACSSQVQIWRYMMCWFPPFSTGPFFPIADTLLILIPYHHCLSIIFRAQGGIVCLAPQRLSNKAIAKEHSKPHGQNAPALTLGNGNICRGKSWTPTRLVAHPSSLLLWHTGYGVTQTLLPLTGVGLALWCFIPPVATHFHAAFMSGTSPLRWKASFCSTAWPLHSQPFGLFLSRS